MHGDPVAARASTHQKSAGQGHEEHQNGNNAESDAGVITIRRGGPPFAAALAFVPISVIATAWGRGGAASASSPNVFDDKFDVRNCGCARHGDFSIPQTLLSGFMGLGTLLRRKVLWHEIFGHVRHSEFVSPTIHHRVAPAKIIGGRRRGGTLS